MNKTILPCIISIIMSYGNAFAGKEPLTQKFSKSTVQKTMPALPAHYSRNDVITLIKESITQAGKSNIVLCSDIINTAEQLKQVLDPERYKLIATQGESVILIPLTINKNTGELFTEQDDPALVHQVLLEVHVDDNEVIKITYIDPRGREIAENLQDIFGITNNVDSVFTPNNCPQSSIDWSNSGFHVVKAAQAIIARTKQSQPIEEYSAVGNTVHHGEQNAPIDGRYTTDQVNEYVNKNCAHANKKFGADTRQSFVVAPNEAMLNDSLQLIKDKSNTKGAQLIFIPILIDARTRKPVGDNPDVAINNIDILGHFVGIVVYLDKNGNVVAIGYVDPKGDKIQTWLQAKLKQQFKDAEIGELVNQDTPLQAADDGVSCGPCLVAAFKQLANNKPIQNISPYMHGKQIVTQYPKYAEQLRSTKQAAKERQIGDRNAVLVYDKRKINDAKKIAKRQNQNICGQQIIEQNPEYAQQLREMSQKEAIATGQANDRAAVLVYDKIKASSTKNNAKRQNQNICGQKIVRQNPEYAQRLREMSQKEAIATGQANDRAAVLVYDKIQASHAKSNAKRRNQNICSQQIIEQNSAYVQQLRDMDQKEAIATGQANDRAAVLVYDYSIQYNKGKRLYNNKCNYVQQLLDHQNAKEEKPGDRAAVLRYRNQAITKTIAVYQQELQRAQHDSSLSYPEPMSFIDQTDSTLETKYIWEQVCGALPKQPLTVPELQKRINLVSQQQPQELPEYDDSVDNSYDSRCCGLIYESSDFNTTQINNTTKLQPKNTTNFYTFGKGLFKKPDGNSTIGALISLSSEADASWYQQYLLWRDTHKYVF